jgi:hypothetical protein
MASTSFSQRRDTQNEGFTTKEIIKKLDEVTKIINIEEKERDLIVNTLEYFKKEVSESYSSKSGKILHNLYSQIIECKKIFEYIDMKKPPSMLTKATMMMSFKKDKKDIKEERLKQYLKLDIEIFKNLEKLKEEMKVLVAYEKVENLTTKLERQNERNERKEKKELKKFLIDLTTERIKNSELKMETAKDFPILGIIEEIGIFEQPFTDEYYIKLTDYVDDNCAMPLEIFKPEELSLLFNNLYNLLKSLNFLPKELRKIVIIFIELNNIKEFVENVDENGKLKRELSKILNLVKDNKEIMLSCKSLFNYGKNYNLNEDLEKVIYTIDNLKTMELSIDYLNELIRSGILHILNLKNLKDSTTDGYLTSGDFLELFKERDPKTLKYILSVNKSERILSLEEILTLLENNILKVDMFEHINNILTDEEYEELRNLYRTEFLNKINNNYNIDLLNKIKNIIDKNIKIKIIDAMRYINSSKNPTLELLLAYITKKELSYLREGYIKFQGKKVKDGILRNGYIGELEKLNKDYIDHIVTILKIGSPGSSGSYGSSDSSGSSDSPDSSGSSDSPGSSGGRKVLSVKKEICGKLRCIYKIPGSRKEHIKYKRRLITVTEYKKLLKAKS